MATVHLHARYAKPTDPPGCLTVCGLECDSVDTAYRGLDPERVTCSTCITEKKNDRGSTSVYLAMILAAIVPAVLLLCLVIPWLDQLNSYAAGVQ